MRCKNCGRKRLRKDKNQTARALSTWEFLMCSGGGFSYDVRSCKDHYEGAIDMAMLRWNDVMQDVRRDKHPLSPRTQQLCRASHPKDGSTISPDEEFKRYGVTERERFLKK